MIAAAKSPNEVALELTGRDYISFSALSAYQACPLRYAFRYIDGLPEESISASLVFGGAIHAAIELYFREQLAGNAIDVDVLVEAFRAHWTTVDLGVDFGNETLASLEALARRLLTAFLASPIAKPSGTILAIEEELRGPVIPGCPDLLARVDLVVDRGDACDLIDFKTSRSRWSAEQASIACDQLVLYEQLVESLAEGKPLRLHFVVLTKTKTPAIDVVSVPFSAERIERAQRTAQRVWRAIDAKHFYPSPSPFQCPSCPYRRACRAWTG